uniref:Cation-transporting P-type ATPase N-terminal domain-containing protein n=1 Tax=Timspurckia oligopyrenoides TaxID=708627 RepID=A0A7S0ZHS1_9RHOD|mmetsp:Transcript_5834/g.10318  ORF Transcript_5834/g.10318 Transcript_5834/m.10318 type:complete len:1171 (+) Transcript_5834:167-3679(+)|eukprot:CAMPEP_0182442154 /NCGR_PEP_ID=MMETSP1172-20130603/1097_1 /TAXON_ID=708627 /ORGANISM="Timspurckia oligopyrenoides, Strain CCMP3278" /LENGTH=1170 /DNA_ID=CAMNT_0024636863 /DNA_START=61 /DNA_END=3573 /DNA_ORIENTATION=-
MEPHSHVKEGVNELDVARQFSETSAKVSEALEKQKKGGDAGAGKEDLKKELEMWEHKVSVEKLCESLETHPEDGLTSAKAKEKLAKDGPNVLSPPKVTPWWVKLLLQFTNFFSMLLTVAAILCFLGYGLDSSTSDNLILGCVLTGVVLVTAIFSFMQEFKSEKTMEMFANFLPPQALVHRDGKQLQVPAADLVVGDVVDIKLGDKVPADLRIIKVSKLKVDNSSLTGESEPQARSVDCTDDNPLETKNLAFFGTLAVDGTATGVVVMTGDRTVFGRIAGLAASSGGEVTTLQIEIHHFVIAISVYALSLGLIFFIVGIAKGTDWIPNIVFTLSIIVANVPEGLLATVTVSLTLTAKRMAKKQVLVKKLAAVETLGSTTTVCSDKTGTLTQNRMTVVHVMFGDKIETTQTATTTASFDTNDPLFREAFYVMVNCAKAEFDAGDMEANPDKPIDERVVNGDASEAGILKFCEKIEPVMVMRKRNPQVGGIPFNSTNKFMVTIHKDESSPLLKQCFKGAPERVLERCSKIRTREGDMDMTPEALARVNEHLAVCMDNGERVLGLATTSYPPPSEAEADSFFDQDHPKFPMDGMTFVGLAALLDPPRESVPGAVAKCQTAGVQVIMVTGDHPATAKSIAKQIGIIKDSTVQDLAKERGVPVDQVDVADAKAVVVPGWELKDFEEDDWNRVLAHEQIVFARTSPQQKLIIVENCQRLGKIVAVTGDGVNDSPALKKANIGVAMGIAGSDVSKEAADMILLDDNFSSIVSGIEEGRLIFDNLKKSIAYTLSSNIPELTPFLIFIIAGLPSALTTILILCVDLGTDMIPAISFAYEKAEADIMERPPRNAAKDRMVNRVLVCFSYIQLGVYQAVAGYFTFIVIFNDYSVDPSLLPGLDSDQFFAAASVSSRRWWFTVREAYNDRSFKDIFFSEKNKFAPIFESAQPGLIQQTDFEYEDLIPTPNAAAALGQTGGSDNAQFNNMIKAVGMEFQLPFCYEFYCQPPGSEIVFNDFDACFNTGPQVVYYSGVNTGVVNPNVETGSGDGQGCIYSWDFDQQDGTVSRARTGYFDTVILVRTCIAFICKTRLLGVTPKSIWSNKVHLIGVCSMILMILGITYIPGLNSGFGAAPIKGIHWVPGIPWAIMILIFGETRKLFMRMGMKNPNFKLGAWLRKYAYW